MNSTTVFAPELNLSTSDPKEALDFVSQHEAQEIPLFTEAIIHRYDETAKEFIIEAESHPYRFTQPAYLEFCHQLGIPERFANKIPNDLLIRCVDEMLAASNEKIRLIVRDQNVIARCQRDTYVATNPREFFQAGEVLFQNHLFREASLSDRGTSILFEPLSGQMIQPNVENPSDQFNVGIAFGLGFQTGLIEAHPYSLRHVCLNVAITRSEVPKYNLVEKLKRKGSSKYYGRLLENYQSDRYAVYLGELNNRISKAIGEPMTDWVYARTFSPMNRLLGKEVTLALLGVSEEQHDSIVTDISYKKKKDGFRTQADSTVIPDLALYEVFNRVTAASKTYSGIERTRLQEIGGELL